MAKTKTQIELWLIRNWFAFTVSLLAVISCIIALKQSKRSDMLVVFVVFICIGILMLIIHFVILWKKSREVHRILRRICRRLREYDKSSIGSAIISRQLERCESHSRSQQVGLPVPRQDYLDMLKDSAYRADKIIAVSLESARRLLDPNYDDKARTVTDRFEQYFKVQKRKKSIKGENFEVIRIFIISDEEFNDDSSIKYKLSDGRETNYWKEMVLKHKYAGFRIARYPIELVDITRRRQITIFSSKDDAWAIEVLNEPLSTYPVLYTPTKGQLRTWYTGLMNCLENAWEFDKAVDGAIYKVGRIGDNEKSGDLQKWFWYNK